MEITYDYYRIFYYAAKYKSFSKGGRDSDEQPAKYYAFYE